MCFSSPTWKQLPAARRKELQDPEGEGVGKEDGEFWMSWVDFKKHYTDFEICSVSIDQLYEDEASERSISPNPSNCSLADIGPQHTIL